jgi:hypothetical protein
VVGSLPKTGGIFPERHRDSTTSVEEVLRSARASQRQAWAECGPSKDAARDLAITKGTREEEEAGWLSPALELEEVIRRVRPLFVPVPRFGIEQTGKVRLVDDYSRYHINGTVESHDKVDLPGIDEIASLAKMWLQAVDWETGTVTLTLSNGRTLVGQIAEAVDRELVRALKGADALIWLTPTNSFFDEAPTATFQ